MLYYEKESEEWNMKYQGSLYVCERKEVTIAFYKEVMGLRVISDFGTNFTFTGGISFQTKDSWATFIEKKAEDVSYGGNDAEIYFEEDDLESLMKRLNTYAELEMIHPIKEHDWGQREVYVFMIRINISSRLVKA